MWYTTITAVHNIHSTIYQYYKLVIQPINNDVREASIFSSHTQQYQGFPIRCPTHVFTNQAFLPLKKARMRQWNRTTDWKILVNSEVFNVRHLIKLCVDGVMMHKTLPQVNSEVLTWLSWVALTCGIHLALKLPRVFMFVLYRDVWSYHDINRDIEIFFIVATLPQSFSQMCSKIQQLS